MALALIMSLSVFTPFASAIANAQATTTQITDNPSDFSILVSPSPLFTTVEPGKRADMTLVVKNTGTGTENLRITPRKFSVNEDTGEVKYEDAPSEIADWTTFSQPTFTLKPNQSIDEHIYVDVPANAGFSYSLAIVISRSDDSVVVQSGRKINGSVAVFALINIDRPGAKRQLSVVDFSSDHWLYEYLPVKLNVKFKNTGNTILQPYGNIFLQRGSDDKKPISTLEVNDKAGYILPGSSRLITSDWQDGFPVYQPSENGSFGLSFDNKVSHFRVGPYTAKLIAVYNDGRRDVSIEKEVKFWVIPWKTILLIIIVLVVLDLLRIFVFRRIWRFIRRGGKGSRHSKKATSTPAKHEDEE